MERKIFFNAHKSLKKLTQCKLLRNINTSNFSCCYLSKNCIILPWWIKNTKVMMKQSPQFLNTHRTYLNSVKLGQSLENTKKHVSVLSTEIINAIDVKENGVYLDMTFGAGGHSQMILESHPSVIVYSLDRDPYTEQFANELMDRYPNRFYYMNGKFSDLPELLLARGIGGNFFNGIIMDLGVSSMQFDNPERGFMVSKNGPLDMRMDGQSSDSPSAAEVLEHIDEYSLYKVLKYYGEEKKAGPISRAIIESRNYFKNLRTTEELGELVISVTGIERKTDKLQRFSHPATKTFQALRILVNDELNELDFGMRLAHFYLQLDGILTTISFHSLEDTIVKRHLQGTYFLTSLGLSGEIPQQHRNYLNTYSKEKLEETDQKPWSSLTKHVVLPSQTEVENNPRSRSAKLRIAAKISITPY